MDEARTIIAGHGRLQAAEAPELVNVPVIVLSGLSEAQRRALTLAGNRIALNAGGPRTHVKHNSGRIDAMRGRKPVPTHIKAITGNRGKRALNAAEPVPPFEIPSCPPELNARAKQEWDRLAELLGALRLLTPLDRAALAAYCAAYGLWAQAIEEVETQGLW